ncbi:sensor histidine kinase [Alkalibacillus haloalkaliphilus]|uniref:Signal transduction histidine-protein kinase/phosphatase DegS n=1 Tax=Alkalibacillus haloalkaliphilus TaxID=94136 RepID=A0A511W643_9BACI|nr:sensor histidine kinase [Alkalibacillus haloalkaliphilus]MDV2582835.1 sensor histidine kinase [Alkalibacillus haloalkaliphilus]GEN46564.1 signal transduction histidine-protein kinase/phosphatase DegS [Alkalibacillus haloalkaliphilus]
MSKVLEQDQALNRIIEEMVKVVSNSKEEIFDLGENARKEQQELAKEVLQIRKDVSKMIDENDQLERRLKLARQRLTEVSRNFSKYSEEQVQKAYNDTHELQTKLVVQRQQEVGLIKRRDELEHRIRGLDENIERTENLIGKVNVVLNYLVNDFQNVNEAISSAKEKYEFGLQIIDAQEEERRKLSREIHDGPAQMLANVMIRSDIVQKTIRERGVDEALKEMKDVKEMVRGALYEVRRIIYDLRPMALDDLGLVPTLRKYLSTIEEYHNIKVEFKPNKDGDRYSQKFEAAAFRLVQEGVQNAIKHANTSLIQVRFEQAYNKLNIHIVDYGKGFNVDEKKEDSFGLTGMRERVEMLNGQMDIKSTEGKGTKVSISLPIMY